MDTRDQIIKELCDNFYDSMLETVEELGFEDFDTKGMKGFITEFITSKAEKMSDDELLTQFGDKIKVIDLYIAFLETKVKIANATVN